MNVKLFRNMDKYILGLLILILFLLKYIFFYKKNRIIQNPKKILVIRLRALGSSLLTFPMIKQLEEHYGENIQYDLLATSRNILVFRNQGYFNQTYNLFKIKDIFKLIFSFKKYDIVIDVEEYFMISAFMSLWLGKINVGYNNIRIRGLAYNNGISYNDKQHSILTSLDLIKKIGINYKISQYMEPLIYTQNDKTKVDNFLKTLDHGLSTLRLICMHTGGAETGKNRARPIDKRISLIKELLNKYSDIKILLSGTDFDKTNVKNILDKLDNNYNKNIINICGKFNLFEFAYILEKCNLMISNDTGPMHLAAAMGTKTIGLFGPELPHKFGPRPLDKNIGLYKGDGKACIKVHLAIRHKDTNYRVDKITVNDVLKNINNL